MIFVLLLIGIVSNVLGTLAGGGGLITLPTMLLLGIPAHSAIGANKVANMISTSTNIVTMLRKKELSGKEIRPIVVICAIGGVLGGYTASYLTTKTLTLIAIILLLFAFLLSLFGKASFGNSLQLQLKKRTKALLMSVGFYDGIFGPGSGTLLIYLFAAEKLAYMKAVMLGRVGIFATCTGAAIVYISKGHIMWYETLFLIIGSIIGAQIGLYVARKVSIKVATILLRCITLILIAQLVIEFVSL